MHNIRAFSLVELSIVLVVIGLLTGGILVGKDFIEGAELQRLVKDSAQYTAAADAFRTQFKAWPGDFSEGTTYWGDNAGLCADGAITDGAFGACNGNGNGFITTNGTAVAREDINVWLQLGSAKLVPETFNYTSTFNETRFRNYTYPGTVRGGAFTLQYYGSPAALAALNSVSGHFLKAGVPSPTLTNVALALLNPQEAASIDTRIDDGFATTGGFMAANGSGSTCLASGDYSKTLTAPGCVLFFQIDRR